MLKIEDIKKIYKNSDEMKGYYIEFNDGRKIHLTKRRTIIALLVLINQEEGTESDIAQGNTTIGKIKKILGDSIPDGFIQDYYADANKPYSELWNEEGFTFIDNLKGGKTGLSQKYTLKPSDHPKLFEATKKAYRKTPTEEQRQALEKKQNGKCNFCASNVMPKAKLKQHTYAKDRRRLTYDHRKPVERGGDSNLENFQGLCFYCNKCKWQICNICDIPDCDVNCALRNPETSKIIAPTKEDILDVLADRGIFGQG